MKQNISIKDILKFLGMVLLTGASGLVLGFGVGYLLAALMRNQLEGWGGLVGAIIGLFVFIPSAWYWGRLFSNSGGIEVRSYWGLRGSSLALL